MSKITIKDIADMAATSKTTVSFYLNGKYEKMSVDTKNRIKKVIKETNYSPSIAARSLTIKKTNLIGVVVADISNPFSSYIVKGIDDVARKEDYQIIVGSSSYDYDYEEKYVNKMLDMGVDGFIVQSTVEFTKLIEKIKAFGKKLVFLDSIDENFKGKWVKTNNYEVTKEALDVLIERGYDNYIFLTQDVNFLTVRMERKKAFEKTLKNTNVEFSINTLSEKINDYELEEIIKDRVELDKKNLIFAGNGKVLQKTYDYLKRNNIDIPNEIGLIGFDNWDWVKYATPTITNIEQPTYEEGKEAARILIDNIENKINNKSATILKCKINWGESTDLKL